MTYQPKSYRKFLATSVAAAMVATVAAPMVLANETTEFTDVVAGAYYADSVNQMAAAGFIKGVGGNVFGTSDELLRRDAAVLFSRVLLWDTTDAGATGFTDVPEDYYTDHIAVAVEKGVINGKTTTTFAPDDKLTRGEMAVLLTRALGLTVDAAVEVPLNDIAGHPYEEQIKAVYQAELTTGFPDGSFKADDTVTRADFATFLYRDATVKANVASAISVELELEVTSVSAINNKEIVITFNKELDTTSAETVANYSLSNGALGTVAPKLSGDKKTVTLTLQNEAAQQAKTDVTVKDVKAADGLVVETNKNSVTFFDTTAPTANVVSVVGPRTLEVEFSEPLQSVPTFVLNSGSYSVAATFTPGDKKVTLTTGASLPEGVQTLRVSGGKDYSSATGFAVEQTDLSFTYEVDKVIPTVSVYKATETVVTLKFSKAVKATNLNADVTAYHTLNSQASYKGTLAAVNPVNGYSDTYTATFSTPISAGNNKTLFLNTKEDKLEDAWSNDVASTSLSFNLVSDVVAPTVSKVAATGSLQREITVSYDKEVVSADAQNKANYILKDTAGNVVKTADFADVDANGKFNNNASIVYDNAKKEAKITLTNALPTGSYQLTVENVKDTSFNSNKLVSQTSTFAVEDKIKPTVGATTLVGANTLYVDFAEAMDATGLTTIANYGLGNVAFPNNTTIELVNNKRVKITLPTGHGLTGANTVRVNGSLNDLAGNSIAGFYQDSTNAFTFGTPTAFTITPVADQLKLVAANQLQFVVNQELSGVTAADFTYTGTGADAGLAVSSVTYVNNAGKATVTVTLDGNLSVTDTTTTTNLAIVAGGLTNSLGTAITGTTTFVQGSGHIEDKLAAKVTEVETTATNQVTITFSEGIPAGELANATFAVTGNTVASVTHAAGASTVVLTLGTNIDTDAKPAVTQTVDIKDANGNVLAAGTAVKATTDGVAVVVSSAITPQIADGASAAVSFSEALTTASKTAVETAISAASGAVVTYSWNAADTVVTVSNASGGATTFAADVTASISDAAGNNTAAAVVVDLP